MPAPEGWVQIVRGPRTPAEVWPRVDAMRQPFTRSHLMRAVFKESPQVVGAPEIEEGQWSRSIVGVGHCGLCKIPSRRPSDQRMSKCNYESRRLSSRGSRRGWLPTVRSASGWPKNWRRAKPESFDCERPFVSSVQHRPCKWERKCRTFSRWWTSCRRNETHWHENYRVFQRSDRE